MNIDYKLIGLRIKKNRKAKNLTQEQLAEKLDVTVGYISQLKRGISKINLDTLGKISSVLNCEITTFLTNSAVNHSLYLCDEFTEKFQQLSPNDKKLLIKIRDDIIKHNG